MKVLKDEKKCKLARYIKDWLRLFPSQRIYLEKHYFDRENHKEPCHIMKNIHFCEHMCFLNKQNPTLTNRLDLLMAFHYEYVTGTDILKSMRKSYNKKMELKWFTKDFKQKNGL